MSKPTMVPWASDQRPIKTQNYHARCLFIRIKNVPLPLTDYTSSNPNVPVNPGRVTLRRLNRNEYNNTIRDLFGVDYQPAVDFPNDEVGYGFDNIGDVLSMSPILMEKYLRAAEEITAQAQPFLFAVKSKLRPVCLPS